MSVLEGCVSISQALPHTTYTIPETLPRRDPAPPDPGASAQVEGVLQSEAMRTMARAVEHAFHSTVVESVVSGLAEVAWMERPPGIRRV